MKTEMKSKIRVSAMFYLSTNTVPDLLALRCGPSTREGRAFYPSLSFIKKPINPRRLSSV